MFDMGGLADVLKTVHYCVNVVQEQVVQLLLGRIILFIDCYKNIFDLQERFAFNLLTNFSTGNVFME